MIDKFELISKKHMSDVSSQIVSLDKNGCFVLTSFDHEVGPVKKRQKKIDKALALELVNGIKKAFDHYESDVIDATWIMKFYAHGELIKEYHGHYHSFLAPINIDKISKSLRDVFQVPGLILFGYEHNNQTIDDFYFELSHKNQAFSSSSIEINRFNRRIIIKEEDYTETFESDFILDLLYDITKDGMLREYLEYEGEIIQSCDRYYKLFVCFQDQIEIKVEDDYQIYTVPIDLVQILNIIFNYIKKIKEATLYENYPKPRRVLLDSQIIYCSVIFNEKGPTYHYITQDSTLKVDDFVLVPAGIYNKETEAQIVSIDYYADSQVPFPLDSVKRIIRKLDEKESVLAQVTISNNIKNLELIDVSIQNIDLLIDYAWKCYQEPKTSFYPVIDHKDEMERIYKTAFMNSHLLAISVNNELGLMPITVDKKRKYIQANGGLATQGKYSQHIAVFEALLSLRYPNYHFIIGYSSKNKNAVQYHQKHYQALDSLLRMDLSLKAAQLENNESYTLLNDENVDKFEGIHTKNFPNVYWNVEAILDHLERWIIVVGKQNSIAGAIVFEKFSTLYAEIYFTVEDDDFIPLMQALLFELKDKGVQEVLYLVEIDALDKIHALQDLGFKLIDDYFSFVRGL